MHAYTTALEQGPAQQRLPALLTLIVGHPRWHARFVNTLARMEYVGVRKMLKARHCEALDLDGMHHLLEEASHALRLKRAAVALAKAAGGVEGVRTFAAEHTLAGAAGEDYLQHIDRACAEWTGEAVGSESERACGQWLDASEAALDLPLATR